MFRFNLWARPFMPPSAQGLDGNPFFPSPIALPPGMTLGSGGSVNPASGEVTKNGLHNVHDKDKDGKHILLWIYFKIKIQKHIFKLWYFRLHFSTSRLNK